MIYAFMATGRHVMLIVLPVLAAIVVAICAIGHGLEVMRQVGDAAAARSDPPRPSARPDLERLDTRP